MTNTAKLQEKIKALTNIDGSGGIDILTNTGEFKSTYDILLAISKVWKDMDDTSQAALLELVAGKTRGSVVAALFQNGDVLEDAYASATEASGSAMRELDTYLDSIEGKMKLFTNAIQNMWKNLVNSKVIKIFVGLGTTLVNLADKVGVIRLLFMGLTTFFMRKSGITSFSQFFGQTAVSADEASKKVAELQKQYDALNGSKNKADLRKQESIARQMKPYNAIVEGAKKAKVAQDNLTKAQEKLKTAEANLAKAQEKGYKPRTIKKYQKAVDDAKKEVSDCKEESENLAKTNAKLGKSAPIVFGKMAAGAKKAIKALWSLGKQILEMYAITAMIDAVRFLGDVIVNAFSKAKDTAEAAQEKLDELRSEFESIESEIDSLNSELENTNEAIDELMDKLTLSFTEQEELDRLKDISAELEKQIAFQETLKDAKSTAVNEQAVKATRKYLDETSFWNDQSRSEEQEKAKETGEAIGNTVGLGIGLAVGLLVPGLQSAIPALAGGGAALFKWIFGAVGSGIAGNSYDSEESVADAIANIRKTRENKQADINKAMADGDAEAYNKATEELDKYDAKMAEHMNIISQNYNSFNWETATEDQKKEMREIINLFDAYNIAMEGQDAVKNALDRLFGADADEVVKAYANVAKNAVASGEAFDFTEADAETICLDDDLEMLGITTQQVTDYFTKLGVAGADAINEIDVSDLVSELAKVEGALESVQSVMEEFKTDGIVSASTLEGMKETFGGLGEAWENYVNTMLSGTATMADAKVATEALAKAYLDKNANDINKDTRLHYIAQLEEFGNIENAVELVDSYINNSFWNSNEFANFKGNAEELIALAKEYGIEIKDVVKAEELLKAAEEARNSEAQYNNNVMNVADENHKKQSTRDMLIEEYGVIRSYVEKLEQLENKEGQFANYTDKSLETARNEIIEAIRHFLDTTGYSLEDLFPDFDDVELDPDVVASKQKWDYAEKEYQEKLGKMKLTVTPRIDMNPADIIEEISEIESGFEALSGAYNEFLDEGVVSAGTLAGLKDTFDVVGMKDEYAKLVTVLGNSKSTIQQVKAAILDMANAYLNTLDITDQIDESEKLMIIEQLSRLGVENAAEWVNARIEAYKKILEAYKIDLNDYITAEEAKLAVAVSSVLGVEALNDDLVKDMIKAYGSDLANFAGKEADKVKIAKEAAMKIAKAHFEAASAAAYNLEVSTLDPNNASDARKEKILTQRYNSGKLHSSVLADYNDLVNKLTGIALDPNKYIDAWFGNSVKIDWGKFDDLAGDGADSTELDWLDYYFTAIENKIKEKEADLENVMSADFGSIDDKNTIIDGIIELYEDKISLLEIAMNAYEDRATKLFDGFSEDIQQKILDGSINISEYDGDLAEKIQEYFDYITKASDLEIEIDGIKVTVADFSLQKFENASTAFDNEIEEKFQSDQDLIEAEIGYLEEQGKRVSPELYQKLIDIQKEEQKSLENKKKTLEDILAAEVAAGRVQVGSEQWYEMKNAIDDVDEAIVQSKNDLEGFQNAINDIYWDNFDKLISQIDAVNSELSNLFDLFSDDDKVVDEFGNWTDDGIASLGLLAQQMENAQAKANEYKQAMDDLESNKSNYSLDEYNEKMAELKDNYLSEIKNIEDLKDAMVDLNKVRIDAVKEAIDKEIEALEEKNEKLKESLDLEKEQYDWQKSVAEKEKSIADIQRRLNALAGDTSASAIAERRKLQAELAEAQQEMDDMWYEHGIEEQQKSLDESLDNYKENKDDEKEALDKWLEDEEKVIQESFDLFNSNVGVVAGVLEEFEKEHGIKLSEAIVNPWNSGIDAMDAYRQKLAEMKQEQEDAKQDAEDAANDIVESLDEPQTDTPVVEPSEPTVEPSTNTTAPSETSPSTEQKEDTTTSTYKEYKIKSGDTLSGIAKKELGKASRWKEIYNLNKDIIKDPNRIYPGQKIKLPHYAKGTMGAEYDHWAMVDELGPELQLVPDGAGRLSYITRGTSVIPHDLSEKLVDLALDPTKVLDQSRPKLGAPHITTNNFDIDLNFGSLVHVDHCDQNTLPDLQKMVRGEFDNMMKTLNQKLKRK